jgi:hypothetical protein
MIGFPHSSRSFSRLGSRSDSFDVLLHGLNYFLSTTGNSHGAGNGSDVRIDLGQRSRSQSQESHTCLENFSERFLLEGNCRNYQVGMHAGDLFRICSPRVGKNCARPIGDGGHDVSTVACTRDDAFQFADRIENHSRARLQARNSARSMVHRHSSILNIKCDDSMRAHDPR